jgi:hypothetical protein
LVESQQGISRKLAGSRQKADGLTGEKAKEKKNIESGKIRKEIQG